MLFIGKSLHQIRSLGTAATSLLAPATVPSEMELLPLHIRHLSAVSTPISSARLSEAVAAIRASLSRNMLQHLLPLERMVETLALLQEFFLLGRGEFAVALIAEADEALRSRHRGPASNPKSSLLLKDGEVGAVLARTWSVLASLGGQDDRTDDALDLASDLIRLIIPPPTTHRRPGTPARTESVTAFPTLTSAVYDDLLLGMPTQLTLEIRSPLDLFLTKSDMETYSTISAYLLGVRRAHLHLSELWRHSSLRREHPAPPRPQFSATAHGKATLQRRRQRANDRGRGMRKVWATCAAAVFFLSESEAYFEGEVVQQSWRHFRDWVTRPAAQSSTTEAGSHHDPETVASAQRRFLASLAYALLLTDTAFTRCLRDLFQHVDALSALLSRLQAVWRGLDLEEDDGVEDALTDFHAEEREVVKFLDRARKRLDGCLKALLARLREIDAERVGAGAWMEDRAEKGEEVGYTPLRVGGVDRLLMKLDWGEAVDEMDEDE